MPGIDLILPPLNTPVVARLRPMQSPVAQMGGPAPYVPQSNAGERALEKGSDALTKGLVNILDNAFDPKTREKRRGDISELKERADVSEANLREDLPGRQARVARGRADLDLQTSAARSKFNLPELEAKAAGARAVAAEKGAAQDAADTDALGTTRQAAERARLELAAASDAYEKADLDLQNNPEDKTKRKAFEQSSRELQIKSKELQNRYDQLRVDEAEYDLSPEGRQARARAAATKNAPKAEVTKPLAPGELKDVTQARTSMLTGARLVSLIGNPEFQTKMAAYTGPLDARTFDLFKKDPQVIEFQQLVAQARDSRLHEMSGAAISASEMDRLLQGLVDFKDRDPEFIVKAQEFASRLFTQGQNTYQNYLLNPAVNEPPATLEDAVAADLADRVQSRSLKPGDEYTDASGVRRKLTKETAQGLLAKRHSWMRPRGTSPETSAAAPQAQPSVTPAQVQQAYDQKINTYLQGTSDPSSYPPGLLNFLNGVMGAPEGVPLESLPGHRIRFDEKTRRIIVVPDRTP